MQYGPGAENAFAGVATALRIEPGGVSAARSPAQTADRVPDVQIERSYAAITKSVEEVILPEHIVNVYRAPLPR